MQQDRWASLLDVTKEVGVKKLWFFLIVFMSVADLMVALAIIRGYVSVQTGAFAVIAAFALGAGLFLWWNRKRKLQGPTQGSDKTRKALIWLLLAVAVPGVGGIIQAMDEKWDSGNTFGLAFLMLFATLCIYEIIRLRRVKDSK